MRTRSSRISIWKTHALQMHTKKTFESESKHRKPSNHAKHVTLFFFSFLPEMHLELILIASFGLFSILGSSFSKDAQFAIKMHVRTKYERHQTREEKGKKQISPRPKNAARNNYELPSGWLQRARNFLHVQANFGMPFANAED